MVGEKFTRLHEGPLTTSRADTFHTPFVYAEKMKVLYFLNTPRILQPIISEGSTLINFSLLKKEDWIFSFDFRL